MLHRLRPLLLEIWAVMVLGTVIGFLGPFGTYAQAPFAQRLGQWCLLLMEAYVVVRPIIAGLGALARLTGLPRDFLLFWGTWLGAAPVVVIWRLASNVHVQMLADLAVLLPTSLLCSIAMFGVTRWASAAEARFAERADAVPPAVSSTRLSIQSAPEGGEDLAATPEREGNAPVLAARLSPGSGGPILALQSEDHYVRVHTAANSELLLMRLRDAIAEMDGIAGEQVHRSWWVAAEGISEVHASGRNWAIRLTNGENVPIARDSLSRLQRSGFLPRNATGQ